VSATARAGAWAHAPLVAILTLALILLVVRLNEPSWGSSRAPRYVFDEKYTAFTAFALARGEIGWFAPATRRIAYLDGGAEWLSPGGRVEWSHPPGAPLVMAGSTSLFGYSERSCRGVSIAAALIALCAVWALAGRRAGWLACVLLLLDPQFFVFARTAMPHMLLTSSLAAGAALALCARRARGKRYHWLACGAVFGFAASVRWSALPIAVAIVVATLAGCRRGRVRLVESAVLAAGAFVVAYAATFGPFLAHGYSAGDLFRWHRSMVWFHDHMPASFPGCSPWYLWPIRPVLLDERAVHGQVAAVEACSLRVLGLALVPVVLVGIYRARRAMPPTRIVAVSAIVATWLPWAFVGRFGMAYYLLPSLPFVAVLFAQALVRSRRRWVRVAPLALAAAVFVASYPTMTGRPTSRESYAKIRSALRRVDGCILCRVPPTPNAQEPETSSVRAGESERALRLLVSTPGGVRTYPLVVNKRTVLGRAPECDVVIDVPSVSRRHAAVDFAVLPFVEDLGSRHGTKVQGRLLSKGERSPLAAGSVFEMGTALVVVQREAARDMVPSSDAVVVDRSMRDIYSMLDVVAPSTLSVLLLGETGTGKEVFAAEIHARSPRSARKFLPINCAALSETLLESELFGHEKGAFTNAIRSKLGLFESADGGTVFLDEVGELPLATQAKLLRVLENGEVMALGSVTPKRVDVRFVAATNRDLASLVAEGRFRADLMYRLNGFTVTLPALRHRREDVLPLAHHFAVQAAARLGQVAPSLEVATGDALLAYSWPGNVRELRNVMDRAVSFCRGAASISPEHLSLPTVGGVAAPRERVLGTESVEALPTVPPTRPVGLLRDTAQSFEKERVLEALERAHGNQTEAAKLLGVSRRTLINKIISHGIARPRKGAR
jgi:two-component system, NtrC family, response regulator AtoC